MISVAAALEALFDLTPSPRTEIVPLLAASGRVLARDAVARRDQPPFAASAMDGYAVVRATPGARLRVIGEAAAGRRFEGSLAPDEAVRIFTGAPLPEGATAVVIQEDVTADGAHVVLGPDIEAATHVRAAGNDFRTGSVLGAPRRLGPNDIALLAAMNLPEVEVFRRPDVAIIATGDELVAPGDTPGPDQIVASNSYGLHALLTGLGATPRMMPIARDTVAALHTVFDLARGADLVLTIGGASVGDHDLVARAAAELGLQRAFHKVAMRPGKPLMSGRMGDAMMIGLPGNPVSAMVCGHVFVAPVIRAMQGLPKGPAPRFSAPLAQDIGANGPREHYMRASLDDGALRVFDRQDSSLLSVLNAADVLAVRPPRDPGRRAGEDLEYLPL